MEIHKSVIFDPLKIKLVCLVPGLTKQKTQNQSEQHVFISFRISVKSVILF
jgi:hypothetical protein